MGPKKLSADSWWLLSWDLVSAHVLIWLASVGKPCELTREGHWYLFDRYSRLADYHRQRGRLAKATHYEAKASEHSVDDEGPYAAAMAMPRPRRFVQVNAVSTQRFDGHDDVA